MKRIRDLSFSMMVLFDFVASLCEIVDVSGMVVFDFDLLLFEGVFLMMFDVRLLVRFEKSLMVGVDLDLVLKLVLCYRREVMLFFASDSVFRGV